MTACPIHGTQFCLTCGFCHECAGEVSGPCKCGRHHGCNLWGCSCACHFDDALSLIGVDVTSAPGPEPCNLPLKATDCAVSVLS